MNIDIIKHIDSKDIANYLDLSLSTVKRWYKLKVIPIIYKIDICKFLENEIDYSHYSYKEKDQFYTPTETSKYCYCVLKDKLKELNINEKEYTYIEPSVGNGSFFNLLPNDRRIGIDIETNNMDIIKTDYLLWFPYESQENKKYIVIGNPPFGLRGNLALRFIKHSYKFADFVAFILPQLFDSDGKGNMKDKCIEITKYNLIHSEKLITSFYYPNNKEVKVNVVFQIWSKLYADKLYINKKINNDLVKIYSLSDGGTPSSTRNKNMINKCHIYIPSTCYGKENMKIYNSFELLPNRRGYGIIFKNDSLKDRCNNIKWGEYAFLSTNSAYNIRTSIINNAIRDCMNCK